jgi:hypothetical protein
MAPITRHGAAFEIHEDEAPEATETAEPSIACAGCGKEVCRSRGPEGQHYCGLYGFCDRPPELVGASPDEQEDYRHFARSMR